MPIVLSFHILLGFALVPAVAQENSQFADGTAKNDTPIKEVKLPGTVSNLCVGGNGRYILLHFADLRKIGVFDINELKIAGYIPANDDDVRFAAGATRAVLVSGSKGIITRWNLQTLERELTQSIDLVGPVAAVLMGWTTEGPVVVSSGAERHSMNVLEVDLATLKSTPISFQGNRADRQINANARISANGDTISVWESQVSPSGLQSYYRAGGKWNARYEHDSVGAIVPTPDGRHLITQVGIYTKVLQLVGQKQEYGDTLLVPATNGPLLLGVPMNGTIVNRGKVPDATGKLYLMGDSRSLASNVPVEPITIDRFNNNNQQLLPSDRRLVFNPDANLIIQVSATADQLKCISYDVSAALENSKASYLIVSSQPAEQIAAGKVFEYQVDVKSSAKQLKFNLDTGPTGMSISPDGKLTWKTGTTCAPKNEVIVSITTDDGQETYHTFKLDVLGAKGTDDVRDSKGSNAAAPAVPNVDVAQLEEDEKVVKLPGICGDVVVGGAGRYLLMHMPELKKIAVFDVSQGKIAGYIPASDDQTLLAASKDKLFVFGVTQGVISRWNLANQQKEITLSSPFAGPIQSVAVGCATTGPIMVCWSQGTDQVSNCRFTFLDSNSLKEISANWTGTISPHASFSEKKRVRAASNGKYFTVSGSGALMIDGTKVTPSLSHVGGGGDIPSADGKYYTQNGQITNFEKTQLNDVSNNLGVIIPSVTGNYFLTFPSQNGSGDQKGGAKLFMFGDRRPLLSIPELNMELPQNDQRYQLAMNPDLRVFFVPDAKVILMLSATNDSIKMRRFDVDQALDESGIDYLIVSSRPQSTFKLGEDFDYAMQVKSKMGGLKYKIESGPKGMTISSDGRVSWKVPLDLDESTSNIVITVNDSSGQEVFHTFTLEVPEMKEILAKREAERIQALKMEQAQQKLKALKDGRNLRIENQKRSIAAAAASMKEPLAAEEFASRIWTDSTGNHKFEATFVKILDRKVVVLADANGNEKKVPLERLSVEDIYHAVECDVKRNIPAGQGLADTGSPFSDSGSPSPQPSEDPRTTSFALSTELNDRISELMQIIENEQPSSFVPKVFHPESVAARVDQFATIDKVQLLETILQLDTGSIQVAGDSVQFVPGGLKMQKHNGKWYLVN